MPETRKTPGRRLLAAAASAATLFFLSARSPAAVFIVRHAEKQTDANEKEVPLSEAGRARARRLAEILRDARIVAVYSTDTVRTLSTAEPLMKASRIEPAIYGTGPSGGEPDLKPLADRIRKEHPEGNVLVVGHSNTIAPLVRALGSRETVEVGAKEYDGLWVVVPAPGDAPVVLLRLRQ
ncbi:MAG: phosphoglycerate mutase family protein [Acidobacteriota bacterium]